MLKIFFAKFWHCQLNVLISDWLKLCEKNAKFEFAAVLGSLVLACLDSV